MSMLYRLELTEEEKRFVERTVLLEAALNRQSGRDDEADQLLAVLDRLRALEPVGTEGGS